MKTDEGLLTFLAGRLSCCGLSLLMLTGSKFSHQLEDELLRASLCSVHQLRLTKDPPPLYQRQSS